MIAKALEINPIMTKAATRFGTKYPPTATDFAAGIVNAGKPNATISLMKVSGHNTGTGRSFVVGDIAEYDSYNLSYTGTITKITAKCVTIKPRHSSGKVKRLSLDTFAWRNYDFDVAETAAKNADTMMYI